jgi:hypothetical protein
MQKIALTINAHIGAEKSPDDQCNAEKNPDDQCAYRCRKEP